MRIATCIVPLDDALALDAPDGYWRVTPRERLKVTRAKATAAGAVWLAPYVPRYRRQPVGVGAWDTSVAGVLRATAVRAMRRHFEDSASDPAQCLSLRCWSLVDQWRELDPSVRWADVGDVGAWPVAWRVDAARLEERFTALARATWCAACDDAPWAGTHGRCLWCERQGGLT